jgi:hypothetical protein
MPVICITVMSSHFHLLLHARDPEHMAEFMGFVKTNISKEAGTLHRWPGPLFADRYHHVEVSDAEGDQIERLKYCLSNGVKEHLVDRPDQWPGVQSATALVAGEELLGHWYDRTRQHIARQRGEKDIDEEQFASEERLVFSPLPCWAHLPEAEWRRRVAELVEEIEQEGAQERERTGQSTLGVESILSADSHYRPKRVENSPKPLFHAKHPAVWKRMWEAWREVTAAFREASARLLAGERNALVRRTDPVNPRHLLTLEVPATSEPPQIPVEARQDPESTVGTPAAPQYPSGQRHHHCRCRTEPA